jgi:hypothetical protein
VYTNESWHPEVPHHLTFSNLTIEGNGAGMTLYGDNHLVHGCWIANNTLGHGIYAMGDGLVIQYNEFDNNGLPPPDVFVHSLYLSQCNDLVFEHNLVVNATDGVKARRCHNSVFRYNIFADIINIGIHLGGDSEGGSTNNRIESNLFYGNTSDIVIKSESGTQVEPVDGLVIANNIMRPGTPASGGYGHHLVLVNDVPAQNVAVVNNLVYEDAEIGGINVGNNGANIRCMNNVVGQFTGRTTVNVDASVTASNNLELTSASAFEELNLADVGAFNFIPTAESTQLIDQGADVSDVLTTDHDGAARPQGEGFDIGPYEYTP